MKKLITLLFFSLGMIILSSCANEADPEADKRFFTKFYDNSNFNIAYTPLDVAQTSDGGYLVLGLKTVIVPDGGDVEPPVIYIMKTDEFGNFISDLDVPEGLRMPAPALLKVDGKFYFFCQTVNNSQSIQLMEVSEAGTIAQQVDIGGTYPLAAGVDGSSLLLLNLDLEGRQTIMSKVSTSGDILNAKGFNIGAADGGPYAPESAALEHVQRTGPQLPFYVGKTTNNLYYFNGIYNYSLSTVFTDLIADNPIGVVQGSNNKGGLSALLSLNGGKFATSRFNYGDNYILPAAALSINSPTKSSELGGNPFPELSPNATVRIINIKIDETDRVIYGSNTRGKQIALFGYNPADGTLAGSRYIGFSNSFELASLTPTADNGLLVLGTTYIAGRFPRICLFKLSAEALGKSFQ